MWLVIIAAVLALAVAGVVYMTVCVAKFNLIQTLAGEKKWLKNLLSVLTIAVIFGIVTYTMSAVNAVIIFLNEAMFFLIFGGVMRLVRHFSGREFSIYWQGWLAIVSSVIYLVAGFFLLHHVWKTDYHLKTHKTIDLKMAMIADSHLGTTFDGEGFAKHLQTIEAQNPDILLIAGDFVDE